MTEYTSQPTLSRRAFTLLEVMIVLGIVAMVLAISLPALRFAGKQEPLDMAVEMLTDLTDKARADAILDRRKQLVVIDLESAEKGLGRFGLPETQRQLAGDGQVVEFNMEPQILSTNRFPVEVSFVRDQQHHLCSFQTLTHRALGRLDALPTQVGVSAATQPPGAFGAHSHLLRHHNSLQRLRVGVHRHKSRCPKPDGRKLINHVASRTTKPHNLQIHRKLRRLLTRMLSWHKVHVP